MIIKNRNTAYKIFIAMLMCCAFVFVDAQPVLKTSVDKNEILIGEQFTLKISADFTTDKYFVNWIKIPDVFDHFEVIERSEVDSAYSAGSLIGYEQSFTLTSFDSGKWALPSFKISFDPKAGDTTLNFFTDAIPVVVSYSVSDTTQQLKDIKPIREADKFNPILYWVISGVLLLLLIASLIWFYKYWKKSRAIIQQRPKIFPYDEAKQQLEKLKQMSLSSSEEIKLFHSSLTDVFKRYAFFHYRINHQNKTTDEILIMLKEQELNSMSLSALDSALRSNDAVKFAKYLPDNPESKNALNDIEKTIRFLANNDNHNNL